MKPFEFDNGSGNARDAILDSVGSVPAWEPAAYAKAVTVYFKRFGIEKLASTLRKVSGFADPNRVPSSLHGLVIAHIAWELVDRPWRAAVANQKEVRRA